MFGRKKEERGLYTGDAPVSAPGFDGAAPTAYYRPAEPAVPTASTASTVFPPSAGSAAWDPPSSPGSGGFDAASVTVSGPLPPDADLVELERLVAQQIPPQIAGKVTQQIERLRASGGMAPPPGQTYPAGPSHPAGPAYPGRSSYRPTSMPTPGVVVRARKGKALGCLLSVIVLVGVIVGSALLIVGKVGETVRGATGSQPTAGRIGTPVTARYGTATLSLTVGRAVAQPGAPWSMAFSGATPTLLVEVDMTRTDGGTSPVTVIGWDWAFTETGTGRKVTGDIIGDYQPDLTDPELAAGDSAHGWLSFNTDATAGTLSFSDALASKPSVSWPITATKAAPVTGSLGTPAQGVISAPDFTVTVSGPRSVPGSSAGVQEKPNSGRYLLADVAFDVAPDIGGTDAQIRDDTFVFVPTGGRALTSTPGAVAHAINWTVLSSDARTTAVLAFDTTATSGTLSMRDGAGNVVVVWTITTAGTTAGGTAGRPATGSATASPPAPTGSKTTPKTTPKTTGPKTTGPTTAPRTTAPKPTGPTTAPKTTPKTG